ncbi:MAG: ImmA/IrrE family metallo-endopeptidase [Desulfobulbaceae bacterium]|nr:ImmA/IrrE family metallo-endopeptidase [Desulfobulbaceae bacterium]
MAEALITPTVLKWARERAEFSDEEAAHKAGVKRERFLQWEEGEALPTFRQAQLLAKAFRIPFGYLYLQAPPPEVDKIDIPDLRTVGGHRASEFSLAFIDLYHDLLRKQEWFREYRLQEGASELPFVGKFTIDNDYKDVARDIREELGVNSKLRASARDWEHFITRLVEQAEMVEILVMRNSIVGNNTHRPLSVDEFRGLVISDSVAPLVFINSADAKSAQVFTLAHELAHLWIGESGVSNPMINGRKNGNQSHEVFCNKVATEVLVPEDQFIDDWDDSLDVEENLSRLSKQYRVSQLVIARRGYDLDILDYEQFKKFYISALSFDRAKKQRLTLSDGGPPPYTNQKIRNGRLFSQAVLSAAFSGRLPLRDAGFLLGLKPAKLRKFSNALVGK